jgi:hypothetical protein
LGSAARRLACGLESAARHPKKKKYFFKKIKTKQQ